jgi:hypothetical protein
MASSGEWLRKRKIGRSLVLYHETPRENIGKIRENGLTTHHMLNRPNWYTLTDSFEGAVRYAGGDRTRFILEFHIPKETVDEYIFPFPGYSEHYGNQYALKKQLPKSYLKKVHPVSEARG